MLLCVVFIFVNAGFVGAGGKAPLVPLNDGHAMPALALGTLVENSSDFFEPEGEEVEKAVLWALKAGYRHIDTAWVYQVENQVGRALAAALAKGQQVLRDAQITTTPRVCNAYCYLQKLKEQKLYRIPDDIPAVYREELFITTKLWNDAHAQEMVVRALAASLDQLQLSFVDLYLIHWPIGLFANQSYDPTHYLTTWRGMMEAQRRGLTRSIGVANFNREMLEQIRLKKLATPAVLQVEWNLNLQQPELLAYCRRRGIAVAALAPLGPLPRRAPAPPRLRAAAARSNRTVAQLVLRYALELGVVPVPKALSKRRIEEFIGVFDFALSVDDKRILRSFDTGNRTVVQPQWRDHPFYPFERPNTTSTTEEIHFF